MSNAVSRPHPPLPANSCDCHVHVFDPANFPYVAERSYTPGPATIDDLLAFEAAIGMDRMVLVQPSVYGTDNRCLVHALRKIGRHRARGVAVIDLDRVTQAELDDLHAAGVRSIRLNLEVKGDSRLDAATAALRKAEHLLAARGWSVQLYADLPLVLQLADLLKSLKIRVMLDHFAGARVEQATDRDYALLRELTHAKHVWIKLSAPYRASKQAPAYDDMRSITQALVGDDAAGLVWASDWPHTGSSGTRSGDLSRIEPFREEDDGRTINLLSGWIDDDATRRKIFVDNPAVFYGF